MSEPIRLVLIRYAAFLFLLCQRYSRSCANFFKSFKINELCFWWVERGAREGAICSRVTRCYSGCRTGGNTPVINVRYPVALVVTWGGVSRCGIPALTNCWFFESGSTGECYSTCNFRTEATAFYDKVVADGTPMSFLRVLMSLTEHVGLPWGLMINGRYDAGHHSPSH